MDDNHLNDKALVKKYWPETACDQMCNAPNDEFCKTCDEQPVWNVAARFTRLRLVKIQELKRELAAFPERGTVLQSQLDELTEGMANV